MLSPNGSPFPERNVLMCKRLIGALILRGQIKDEADCLVKLSDGEWVEHLGYGHVAHILSGDAGREACRELFHELGTGNTRLAEA